MAEQITQCPHCDTAFRVTEAHLEAANGAVRCGNCQEIFDARQNRVITEDSDAPVDAQAVDSTGEAAAANETISESYISELLEEGADTPVSAEWDIPYAAEADPATYPTYADADPASLEGDLHFSSEVLSAGEAPPRAEPREEKDAPPAREELLANIEAEPVELHWQESRIPPRHRLPLSLGIIAAAALLIVQFAWANLDHLASEPRYRGWLGGLCVVFRCTLPLRSDIHRIHSDELVIRSHPDEADALIINTIITNRADFQQPFPILQLQFSDINGKPVAHRAFESGEYLAGELAGKTAMPVNQPVHIALELIDPGPRAVNYSLSVHPSGQ
jgi:predicted Zn finger-like uncharacterized protein